MASSSSDASPPPSTLPSAPSAGAVSSSLSTDPYPSFEQLDSVIDQLHEHAAMRWAKDTNIQTRVSLLKQILSAYTEEFALEVQNLSHLM